MSNESKKGYLKFLAIVFIGFIVIFFRSRVCERVIVNGQSMEPNFSNSDVCWADKNFKSIERYDVVVAKVNNRLLIKRVIGLPSDTIQIKNGTVYINDEKIDDKYDFETYPDGESSGENSTYHCGEDEYFLMGDNRQHSVDCRLFGPVKRIDINGKIVIRFYPFDRIEKF